MTLDPASSSDVTVGYATANGTATSDSADPDGADYTAPASGAELTISASQTSGTISIATGDDAVFEVDETFTVTLASPSSNAVLGTQKTATGTIENNDAVSTDTALKALTITAAGSDVTLLPTFALEEHNYRASVDNTVASVSVAAEANHRKATVAIIEGTDLAFGENPLTLRVTAEDGITTQDYTVTVTRALPELTWESQSTLSLDEDAGAVELTVTLTPASSDQVTVDYATLAAGATAGEDYTQASGTLTFAAGETQKTTTVTILDDTLYETGSVNGVLVELSNATGTAELVGGTTTIYLQIQDNESPPTATMENVTVDEGAGTMAFTLSLTHGIDTDIEYSAGARGLGGTATERVDYAAFFSETGSVNLKMPARQTSATFAVTILDDDVHEADETISMRWIRIGSAVATGSIDVTGTITNDDERGVEVSATTLTVPEGANATYTVVLTSQPTGDVTVTPSVSGSSEVTVSPSPLTFTASTWAQAQTVTVSAGQDADAAADTATIGHAVSGGDYGVNSVTAGDIAVTVDDDETVSTEVTLTVNPASVLEDAGATEVTVTGTLNGGARAAATVVTVSVGAPVDGAVEGTDYTTVNGFTLTIDAGLTTGTQTFTLAPADDDIDEADKTLTVAGSTTAAGFTVNPTAVTIADDDERGVEVSATELTAPEGGDVTYTVVLTSQPTGDVTVTPSVSGSSEVTVSPSPLTFTASTWAQAQTVTVSAGQDADAAADTATIGHAVSGGDYGVNSVTAGDIAVTVDDDETVSTEVTLTVDPAAVDEGDSATTVTVTGTLNGGARAAATVVTVSVGAPVDGAVEGTDYTTVNGFTLTIDAGLTTGTQTFTLAPADDDIDEADKTLTVAGSTTAAGFTVNPTAVTIADDDERGVEVSATELTVPEGGDVMYTVVLTSQPTGDVTVTPSVSGSSEVTVSPSPLTFTASTWAQAQTVTVSAGQDADAAADTATIGHAVSGGDYGVNSVTAGDIAVTVDDDETVSTEVTLTVDPAAVDEGDSATTVTVTGTLNGGARAAATVVTVSVGAPVDGAVEGTDYTTVNGFTLTIDAGLTTGTQTFTLAPADDDIDEADKTLTVAGSTTAAGFTVNPTAVTIADDDERGVEVSATELTVPEGGDVMYTVVLTSQPTGDVTVTPSVSGSSEVTVSPSPLTFTASTWAQAQTVTVSAGQDADAAADPATIGHAVSGGDYGVNSVTAGDIAVTVDDDETVSTEVTLTVDPAAVDEGDSATTVTVTGTLNGGTRAAATVVTVSVGAPVDGAVEGTDYTTVNGFTLTIDAGLTTGTQTFTLAPADDDIDEADKTLTVAGSTTAAGFTVNPTAVTIADDDERGVEVSATELTAPEGGDVTYTVVLTSQPTGNVTVTPSVSGSSEVTVSPSPLTFTASTWAQAQTVTVSAGQDADAAADPATIGHAVSGGDYGVNSVTAGDIAVTVDDDETVSTEVTLTVDPAAVDEGDSATTVTVTGTLNGGARAAATVVTVSVGAPVDGAVEGTDYTTVNGFTLTIDAGLTTGTQTFTLAPADDDIDEADKTLTVAGSTTAAGFTVNPTAVTIADDDERGVEVSATELTVPEGGDVMYTVVLTSQPTGDVTVTPSVSGSSEVTVSPSPLTFTASTWAQAQTVTVSAGQDADAAADPATIGHAVSGGDYGVNSVTAGDIAVTVDDDETVSTEVTLTVDPAAVDEGDSATTVTVTGTLNGGTRAAATVVTVSVGAPVDGAVEGTDYTTVNGFTLTIDAGLTTGTQTFTLAPADDDIDEADKTLTVAGSTTAAGFTVNPTAVTIADDDERGVEVSATELTAPEGGDVTYTVVLTSQPTGNVTVTPSVSGSSEVTVSPSPLTFTASTWAQAQTVTVSAGQDADAAADPATIGHAVSGGDYGVNSVTAGDIAVTVDDDETVSTEVTLTVDPAAVDEGDSATTVTVTGTLNGGTRAAATVVTVSVGDAGDAATEGTDYGTLGSVTLTIDTGQTTGTASFTLAPSDDDVDEANEALTVAGSTTAAGFTVNPTAVTIADDDERGVEVSATELTVPEGGDVMYTVVLTSQPTGNVTVTPSVSGSSEVTVSPSPLTFTASTWAQAQTVTVSAGQDADAAADTATIGHAVSGGDYGVNSVTAGDIAVTVDDDETVSDIPGQVTGLSATATVNKVTLAWTAPQGTVLGYRIEVSHDGGTVWAAVEDNTNGTSTAYAHGSGLMAGETRHYRVSAITDEGAGPPAVAVEANATDTVDGLTATGVATQDTPNGMATIDLCWKPAGVAVSDLGNFAIRERRVHPSLTAEWSDQHWSPRVTSTAADCEEGSIGFRVTGSIVPNSLFAYQVRARYGVRWALSNDAEAASVNTALELRAEVLTGNSGLSVDTDVPATVCPAYDDPATSENDAGSFIVNIGFSTGPAVLLYYEAVTGFVLDDDVTLENATAELIDRPYGTQLGYRVRITPTTWGQSVAVSVPAGVVTHFASSVSNQASNVFRRNTTASADCDTGSDITIYPPAVRRIGILDDDDRNGVWSTGERVRATLEFSEPVTVTTDNGIPTVSLGIDGNTVQASYAGGTGSDTLVFEHVVTAEQSPFDKASLVANSLSLNGGAIASPDGPAAALAHPGAVKRMEPAPEPSLTAEWVKFPPGHSGNGRKFTIRVKFSDPVTIGVRNFRADALSVTGGVVDKVWRVKKSGTGHPALRITKPDRRVRE